MFFLFLKTSSLVRFLRFYYKNLTSALRKNFSIVMPQILLPYVIF